MKQIAVIVLLILFSSSLFAHVNFFTSSLHRTRNGMQTAYSKENGGMETITDIPISQLKCQKCHSVTGYYANNTPIDSDNYLPICVDCHNFSQTLNVLEETCLNCHTRQNAEMQTYPDIDVHKKAGLTCISCHSKEELHGDDGIIYSSLKEKGAVKVSCQTCHTNVSSNSSHNRHLPKVDCAACHAVSVLTCAGCHFETFVTTGKNREINQLTNYRLLIKKDDKVKLGGFVTHSYNGKTNYIISSYHSHIIKKDATKCSDCHRGMGTPNPAITEYNNTGFITLAKWDSDSKQIIGPNAVVPIPGDWKTSLKIDHVTYTGDPSVFPSDPNLWVYLKSESDNAHMFFAEPLDSSTLAKLGFTRFPTGIERVGDQIPTEFLLYQNYPNPFNPATKIRYSIAPLEDGKLSNVLLNVFDSLGKEILTLVNEAQSPGIYEVDFNASNFSSGIYYYKLTAGSQNIVKKMIFLK